MGGDGRGKGRGSLHRVETAQIAVLLGDSVWYFAALVVVVGATVDVLLSGSIGQSLTESASRYAFAVLVVRAFWSAQQGLRKSRTSTSTP
jgi:hypothetical protein